MNQYKTYKSREGTTLLSRHNFFLFGFEIRLPKSSIYIKVLLQRIFLNLNQSSAALRYEIFSNITTCIIDPSSIVFIRAEDDKKDSEFSIHA